MEWIITILQLFLLNFKENFYNLEDPRDAKEILNYLKDAILDDETCDQIKDCDNLDLIFFLLNEVNVSVLDDATSDGEEVYNVHTIGKGTLKQQLEIKGIEQNEKAKLNSEHANGTEDIDNTQ